MLPLLAVAGLVWGYNAVKIAQLTNRNRLSKRDSDDESTEKNLTIYKDCNFHYEDKRTYHYYSNCTFNYYITIKGKDDE